MAWVPMDPAFLPPFHSCLWPSDYSSRFGNRAAFWCYEAGCPNLQDLVSLTIRMATRFDFLWKISKPRHYTARAQGIDWCLAQAIHCILLSNSRRPLDERCRAITPDLFIIEVKVRQGLSLHAHKVGPCMRRSGTPVIQVLQVSLSHS